MTGSDLFVLAPWVIFGVGLAAVVFRLCRPGYSFPRRPPPRQPSQQPESDAPAEAPRPAGRGKHGAGA